MRLTEKLFILFSWCCGAGLLLIVASLVGYLLKHGASVINLSLVFGNADPVKALLFEQRVFHGLFPAIAGTVFLVGLAVAFCVPVGIGAGIYLAEYAGPRLKQTAGLFIDILACVPSVVVGLFGFALVLFLHHNLSADIYPCLLISAVSLATLSLPYVIRTTQVALESQPALLRKTAYALGATRLQCIFRVLLPRSLSGLFGGVVLATGRCAEDTAVIMLTGVVASAGVPTSLFGHYEALPFYIFFMTSEYSSPQELNTAYGAALILLVICLLLFGFSHLIKTRISRLALV